MELAQDHHLAANCTNVLVLWNVSCKIVRYVMESRDAVFSSNEVTIRSELLQLKRCANYRKSLDNGSHVHPVSSEE